MNELADWGRNKAVICNVDIWAYLLTCHCDTNIEVLNFFCVTGHFGSPMKPVEMFH